MTTPTGLLTPEWITRLRADVWLKANPIQTCEPPPRKAQLIGLVALCPIYNRDTFISQPKEDPFGGPSWTYNCPICGFEHDVDLDRLPKHDWPEPNGLDIPLFNPTAAVRQRDKVSNSDVERG